MADQNFFRNFSTEFLRKQYAKEKAAAKRLKSGEGVVPSWIQKRIKRYEEELNNRQLSPGTVGDEEMVIAREERDAREARRPIRVTDAMMDYEEAEVEGAAAAAAAAVAPDQPQNKRSGGRRKKRKLSKRKKRKAKSKRKKKSRRRRK